MFERYTDKARGALFLARYEASILGSSLIEAEHLLLSLLKEDKILLGVLREDVAEAIRIEIGQITPRGDQRDPTIDLPLSVESKRALAYSAEEAVRLGHEFIDCPHLTLGLLRVDGCIAAILLREHGIQSVPYRSIVGGAPAALQPVAPWLGDTIAALENLVGRTRKHLKRYADVYGEQQPQTDKPWTRKQDLGHLVDWAAAHHVWLARALTEPRLAASGYPSDSWVSAQKYENYVWQEIVDLWAALNLLLIHVLAQIPEGKLGIECRIGIEKPIPLSKLVERYVEHCEGVVASILA
jgi:hypothetical protein